MKMGIYEDRVGEIFETTTGQCEIIKCEGRNKMTVLFDDGTVVKGVTYERLRHRGIRNKNYKNVFEVGCIGYGKYCSKKDKPIFDRWYRMMERCYSDEFHKKQPTYKDVTVCKEWHVFQNFAEWCDKNYVQGWYLDKDLICHTCKEYSPENCAFVPREINNLMTNRKNHRGDLPIGVNKHGDKFIVSFTKNKKKYYGGIYATKEEAFQVYKLEKEKYIKEVADNWKDRIDRRIYESLCNLKINITD